MLSTENPSPDPSCLNCEISQLKSGDEAKGSDSKNCQLNEVDLLDQSSVVDDKNPLPNFSIRDYVFSKRRKDIKTNWPFSHKALQLCLKCDVKDVLPPFQSLDSVKNPSLVKSVDEHITSFSPDQNVDPKLAVDTENIDSTRSEKETESKISLGKNSEFAVPLVEIENPKPVKKCKLVVNSSNVSEPKSNEGVSLTGNLNHCGVSETTMASKVCPVCKTFSSSSNTTLNAHIDQCLSGESMENSKSIKHRIKPRKMRLMVDIYSTALSCTLEDLDKRNGTNWAWNLGFNAQDLEIYAEEKENEMSSGNVEKCNEGSAVYIDSNGTKVRILSKFNDLPSSSTAKDDNGPKKIVKKDKTSKVLCSKKKKYVVDKDNVSKCPPEVKNGEQREVSIEENLTQPHKTRDQIRSDDLGMIKQWVSSKRTVLRKKMNLQHKKQDKTVNNSGSKSNIVSLKFMKRTNDTNSSVLCDDENPRKRKDNLSSNAHDELSSPRKMVGFSLPTQNLQGNKNHFVKKLRKDGPLIRERCNDPSNEIENHVSPNFKKISQKFSSDGPCISLRMPHEPLFSSKGEEAFTKKSSLEGNKFSSLKKNPLLGKSKNLGRKCLDFKKPKLQYALRSDVEAIELGFARRDNLVETPSKNVQKGVGESLIDRSSFSKIRKRKRQFMSKRQESSDTSESDNNETGASLDATKDVELACEPTSRIADGEAFTTFSKSLSPPFPAAVNPSDVECVSRHFTKPYEENDPPELNLSGEQEIFSIGKVGKYMVSQNTDFMTEMDGNERNGNYVVDVEPIPIPGPPGSFLPSPGRMGSEELPGSSSLTTCKILSSEDERELVVDMHSSDSSQTSSSMVPSFVPARRPDPVPFMKFPAKSQFIQNESQCDIVEGKLKLDESRSNFMLHETANLRLKNDQPCCCSRKEGVLQSGPLNYHDSQFLRQQTMNSLAVEKNVVYSSMGFAPECVSLYSEANFQACEPPSPLSPNPVLRLMGKNLMVVNKDENLHANVENGGNMHNNAHHSFHPPFFETVQRRIPAQHFDFSSSHGFKVPTVCVQLSPHPSTVMFSSKSSSLERNLMPDQLMSNIPGEFSGQKNHNDVTVLDDLPENEPFLANKSAFCDVNMEHGGSSPQIAWGYDSRHVNPLYSYPTMGYPLCSGSRIPNANSQVLHNGKNANLAEWIYAPETSNPLTASSPSTGFGGVKPMTGPVSSVGYSHSLFSIRK